MAINKGPGNGEQIVSIMQGYNTKTNVTTDNHNSIILGSGNVIGDRLNALIVGNGLSLETEIDLPSFAGGTSEPVGPGNGTQIQSIMDTYRSTTNVTTNNNDSIIIGSGNVIGDGLRALVVGDGLSIENDGIATTNLTVTNTLNGRAVSDILPTYTKYIALISQTSTSAPTVIELENTIGPIVWTRSALGTYLGTLAGVFTVGKTYAMISNVEPNGVVRIETALNYIQIITTNLHDPTAVLHDNHLKDNTLEIRVYE